MTDSKNNTQLPLTKKHKLSFPPDDSKRLKNAACKDNEEATTGSGNNVLSIPNSSRSPEEKVFSIDHILESILEKCDRKTLLSTRLVSRRWAICGSKELQKIVCIVFQKPLFAPGKKRTLQFLTDTNRSLKDLITVMNNSPEFPCNSFDFQEKIKGRTRQSSAQSFFDAHGAAIKKMKFEYVCIDDLKTFLLCQAPNLQQLHLRGKVKAKYTHSTKLRPNSKTQEQQSQRKRIKESFFDETTSEPRPILKNLKTLRCRGPLQVPEIFIQQILECSPNLVDVALPSEHIHLLVQPTNRVHFVKKLMVDITNLNIKSYELFANHLQDNENFAVRELYYRTANNHDIDDDRDREEFSARVTMVMRKILRASSTTCQKLVWGEDVDNCQIPRMPQVKHLAIQYNKDDDDYDEWTRGVPINSLRNCVSVGDTFPNLKSLELRTKAFMGIHPIANIFNDVDPLPAANVKTVTMRLERPYPKVIQSIKGMFPNASFRKKVPAGSDSDGDSDKGSGDDETDDDKSSSSDAQENSVDENSNDENDDGEYNYY